MRRLNTDPGRWRNRPGALRSVAAFALACLFVPSGADATSVYGCENLENAGAWASIEGRDGTFFRVKPDLYNYHPMTDLAIQSVVDLSNSLSERGTELILAPVPTKAVAMPHLVDHDADLFGYDGDIATTVYLDNLRRMTEAGLRVAEPYAAMAMSEQRPFFTTDPKLTAVGGRIMANAIGEVVAKTDAYSGFARHQFATEKTGQSAIFSPMRMALQQHCALSLPQAETEIYTTRLEQAAPSETAGLVALVGTEYSNLPDTNFAGFLAEAVGLDVIQYSLPGGGAFGAISTYLTSREFQEQRPDYLVWEFPVYENLGAHGLQPMEELIAAAHGTCPVELDTQKTTGTDTRAEASLDQVDFARHRALLLDVGPVAAGVARFAFKTSDGLLRTRVINRHPDQVPTGRFFVPLSGLWPDGAATVDITVDAPLDTAPRLYACETE